MGSQCLSCAPAPLSPCKSIHHAEKFNFHPKFGSRQEFNKESCNFIYIGNFSSYFLTVRRQNKKSCWMAPKVKITATVTEPRLTHHTDPPQYTFMGLALTMDMTGTMVTMVTMVTRVTRVLTRLTDMATSTPTSTISTDTATARLDTLDTTLSTLPTRAFIVQDTTA